MRAFVFFNNLVLMEIKGNDYVNDFSTERIVKMGNMLDEARKIINDVDAEMAVLFEKRMHAAEIVYAYKKEMGLPILDQAREAVVIENNTKRIEDENLKEYYIEFLKNVMSLSRAYQYRMQNSACE